MIDEATKQAVIQDIDFTRGNQMIHRINGKYSPTFAIASSGVWRPGCYDSERAARYAFRFPDEALRSLQDQVNEREPDHEKRVITFEMLQELYQDLKVEEAL